MAAEQLKDFTLQSIVLITEACSVSSHSRTVVHFRNVQLHKINVTLNQHPGVFHTVIIGLSIMNYAFILELKISECLSTMQLNMNFQNQLSAYRQYGFRREE